MTREVREGRQYEVRTGLPPVNMANLRWLHGYRLDRFAPDDALRRITPRLLLPWHRTGTRPTQGGVKASGEDRDRLHAAILHLMFFGTLSVDLGQPLSMDTHITLAESSCAS